MSRHEVIGRRVAHALSFGLLLLLLATAVPGCSDAGGGGEVPDDDDSAVDDDDSGDDDTVVADDDDTVVVDDDDTTPPLPPNCDVAGVVDPSCVELSWRRPPIAVAMSSCPTGDFTFTGSVAWQLFLAECGGVSTDPLAAHDWGQESILVTIRAGSACFPVSDVLWFANCADGNHFGHAFDLCGDCDTTQLVVNFVAVPAGATPVQFHECVPEKLACP